MGMEHPGVFMAHLFRSKGGIAMFRKVVGAAGMRMTESSPQRLKEKRAFKGHFPGNPGYGLI